MKQKTVLLLCLVLFYLPVSSKVLVVSDIDDTLKISHVLSSTNRYLYAFQTDRVFKGMPEVYHAIQRSKQNVKFVYLSNAPRKLMSYSHTQFLSQNNFPQGNIILREDISDEVFKLKTLRDLIKSENPRTVVLLGDNAENDIYFYMQISKEFSQITFFTYIRTLYKQESHTDKIIFSLQEKQGSFITALDLARKLYHDQFLLKDDWMYLAVLFSHQILSENLFVDESSEYFPSWKECDFDKAQYSSSNFLISSAFNKIFSFCSKQYLQIEPLVQNL